MRGEGFRILSLNTEQRLGFAVRNVKFRCRIASEFVAVLGSHCVRCTHIGNT